MRAIAATSRLRDLGPSFFSETGGASELRVPRGFFHDIAVVQRLE
jgi:hypothetical protein